MSDNPFSSPQAELVLEADEAASIEQYPTVSQGKRLLNFIIDYIVVQFLALIGGAILGIIYMVVFLSQNDGSSPEEIANRLDSDLQVYSFVIGIGISLSYYVFMEGIFQRSLGKLITGTMVVQMNGNRASFGQVVGRSFGRLIPFEAFSFLSGPHPRGWHDRVSKTKVVDVRQGKKYARNTSAA